jgi:S-adenosylmethionine hydrolase
MKSKRPAVITLTTDFGITDWFVGVVKGVIARLAPESRVIDLTHAVPPGDLCSGAFCLMTGYRFFPKGTVHLTVVDPGVGSNRGMLAVQTVNYFFVGPDNGVLSWALLTEEIKAIHSLENEAYFLSPVSQTFQGRDIFAPVAAHLSRGVPIRRLGPAQNDLVRLRWNEPQATRRGQQGEIVYVDQFGNAITNLTAACLKDLGRAKLQVVLKGRRLCAVGNSYSCAPTGKAIAVLGSSGFLEIAVNRGNAAKRLGLCIGDYLEVEPIVD